VAKIQAPSGKASSATASQPKVILPKARCLKIHKKITTAGTPNRVRAGSCGNWSAGEDGRVVKILRTRKIG